MNYRAAKLTWALTAKSSVCLSLDKFAFFLQMITGGIEMEGVYRVNGGQSTMKKLKTAFDQGNAMELWLFIRGHVRFSRFTWGQVSTEFRKTECTEITFFPVWTKKQNQLTTGSMAPSSIGKHVGGILLLTGEEKWRVIF